MNHAESAYGLWTLVMDITINRKNQTHQIIKNRANQEIHHESCGIGLWFMDAGYH